jgi:hypothetical protein
VYKVIFRLLYYLPCLLAASVSAGEDPQLFAAV